nr:substrate-binding domain-containing protein [Leifsonia soli]
MGAALPRFGANLTRGGGVRGGQASVSVWVGRRGWRRVNWVTWWGPSSARREVEKHPGVSLEIVPVDALTVLEGRRAGEELVQRGANRRPDAVFAANDLVAVGLLQGLFINGRIRIPEDISLVGYDDIMFASASVVPLTSIRQPSALIGRTGVEILIEEAQDPDREPRHVLYQPELVVRGSSSADATD